MRTVYACTSIKKRVEDDSYEHGADPDSQRCVMFENVNMAASSLSVLIKVIGERLGLEIDDVWFPGVGDDDTRISFNRLENDDGDEPTEGEMEDFRAGKRKLYLADYDFLIEKRETSPVTLEEFQAAGIKTHD